MKTQWADLTFRSLVFLKELESIKIVIVVSHIKVTEKYFIDAISHSAKDPSPAISQMPSLSHHFKTADILIPPL